MTRFAGWTVRRAAVSMALALVAAGLYLTVVILGAFEDRVERPSFDTGGVTVTTVWIDVTDIDPATQTLDVDVTVFPEAALVDQAGKLNEDLSVTVHPAAQQVSLDFARGRALSTAALKLQTSGEFQRWPFDRYETRDLVVEVAKGEQRADQLIETRVVVSGSIQGWKVDAPQTNQPADQSTVQNVTLHRDAGTLIFAVLLCLVLLALPLFALLVAGFTVQSKRPFYPPMIGWFAIMLFAVVPLRNLFPGAPPLGGWIDRVFVIWVLAALVVAQGMYVYAWWQEGRTV